MSPNPRYPPPKGNGPTLSERQKIKKNFLKKFIFFSMKMGSYMSFIAKNYDFFSIFPFGTHLHLHFDSENHGDGRNNDFFWKCGPI